MSYGSYEDPFYIDSDDSDDSDDVQESVESDFEFPDFDDEQDPTIIDIEDENNLGGKSKDKNGQHQSTRVQSPVEDVLQPPFVEEDWYELSIAPGDTVELHDTLERAANTLHSGDLFYVKMIIRNVTTDEYFLRGYRMRRTKYEHQILEWKLNELVMILKVGEDDAGDPFDAGMEEVPVDQVLRKRECVLTDKPYPFLSFRTVQFPPEFAVYNKDTLRATVFHQGRLTCRWLLIRVLSDNGKEYAGECRNLYARECRTLDAQDYMRDSPSVSMSRESSILLDDDIDGDFVIVNRRNMPRSNLPGKKFSYSFGDCFCGVGGASQGARQAGLKVKWGLDHDEKAILAYGANFPAAGTYQMNAHDFPPAKLVKQLRVHILHLSPPCCYWSPAHTRAGRNDQANYEAIYTVGPILQALKPRVATLEQTYGIATHAEHKRNFRLLLSDILKAGYNVRWKIEDLSKFGVPQRRKRLLIIAARRGTPLPLFPNPTHGVLGSGLKPQVSVWEALRSINTINSQFAEPDEYHSPKLNSMNKAPYDPHTSLLKGCITTSGGDNCHFSGTRRYTARELSLLQTFPSSTIFTGSNAEAIKQIGNAYPPRMAEAMFRGIIKTLEAFDLRLVDAEDNLEDLDIILESYKEAQSQPSGVTGDGSATIRSRHFLTPQPPSRAPFARRSSSTLSNRNSPPSRPITPGSSSSRDSLAKKRCLWARNTFIEPEVKPEKRARSSTAYNPLTAEQSRGLELLIRSRREMSDELTFQEQFEIAEASGETFELD
ncbi:S-adenosyl-L-methionine-dependent methyltransferase [Polyplosphaeria fusca]|uniref:DNA (cytosine-5-)-methyltransferase n=1 Tax=Polyplosphaeria fusca TaxID=682080 RepID=A0A9P4R8F5_9PLEO|nr:S-adenosyl-L-methionine-dependent methyltransferase [Polyplosphaeria fusca]